MCFLLSMASCVFSGSFGEPPPLSLWSQRGCPWKSEELAKLEYSIPLATEVFRDNHVT